MARITPIQIPKTVSSPADPAAPSFLSTLPPEIRNRIYEVLFKRDGEVLLHDAKAYRQQIREYLTAMGYRYKDSMALHACGENCNYCHGFGGCVSLLRTCRQIYHEAVGVLYGSNAFRFSQLRIPAKPGQYRHQEYAPRMLASIGSQFGFLAIVSIDLQVCHTWQTCDSGSRWFDILPFLSLRWTHLHSRCRFQFMDPVPGLKKKSKDSIPQVHRHFDVPVHVLNNLLVTLGDEDILNIRRYAAFSRLLPSVDVFASWQGIFGAVDYTRATNLTQIFPNINVLDGGRNVEWSAPDSTLDSLSRLPNHIRDIIYTYACTTDTKWSSTWTRRRPMV
jgi:hypothetical protein